MMSPDEYDDIRLPDMVILWGGRVVEFLRVFLSGRLPGRLRRGAVDRVDPLLPSENPPARFELVALLVVKRRLRCGAAGEQKPQHHTSQHDRTLQCVHSYTGYYGLFFWPASYPC